jgi:hypothetical protein
LGGSGKEKKLIEVTLASEFCFARWQIRVLGQLARWQRAQRNDRHAGLSCESLKGFGSGGLLFGNWQAGKTTEPDRG